MWTRTHRALAPGLSVDQVWKVWQDIDQWHTWHGDIEYARLEGPFATGSTFLLKPRGGPRVRIELISVVPGQHFTDLTRFPGARMFGHHEFRDTPQGLELVVQMRLEGPLSFVWRRLVAQDVADHMPQQTEALIAKVRQAAG